MDDLVGGHPAGVLHPEGEAVPLDVAGVPRLAAGLPVEGRHVGHQLRFLARRRGGDPRPLAEDRHDAGVRFHPLVPDEVDGDPRAGEFAGQGVLRADLAAFPRDPGLGALFFHLLLEPRRIEGDPPLPAQVRGEVRREPVRVVELEGDLAGEDLAAPGHAGELLLDHPQARVQRLEESPLLLERHRVDERRALGEARVRLLELLDHDPRDPVEEGAVEPELLPVAQRPAHDPAQHVPAPLVGGDDPVGDEEGGGPRVVGDDPHRRVEGRGLPDGHAALPGDPVEDRPEQVRVVVAGHPLHHAGKPLEPHPGVDARLRQRSPRPRLVLVELHEHEVPYLEKPVAVAPHRAPRAAAPDSLPLVVEDFGAGAARPRGAHRPEVVLLVEPDDPRGGDPHRLVPEVVRLVILAEDGDGHPRAVEADLAGEEVPPEEDRLLLEVVAEREVPQHLEERVVPRRVAHVFEVVVLAADPQAPLRRGRPLPVGRRLPEEILLELHHPGVREQQGRIVCGDKRGAGQDLVPVLSEIIEEGGAELRTRHGHGSVSLG